MRASCALAVVLLGTCAAPAGASPPLVADYVVTWGGLQVAAVETRISREAERYRVGWTATTTGFLGAIAPYRSNGSVEGRLAAGEAAPERLAVRTTRRDEVEDTAVRYGPDGGAVSIVLPPDEVGEREPVPPELRQGPDPISAALTAILAAGPGLEQRARTFDGLRALDLAVRCEPEPALLPAADVQPARPEMLECALEGRLLAGGHKRWKDRAVERREPTRVWLERGVLGGHWWPVRVEAQTRWGRVVADLVRPG